MSLSIKGKLQVILPTETGTSKQGKEWIKSGIVLDQDDEYNPLVCFSLFGENKMALLDGLVVGQELEVHFNLSSRAWDRDGKTSYFTSADAWKISQVDMLANEPVPEQAQQIQPEEENDLSF